MAGFITIRYLPHRTIRVRLSIVGLKDADTQILQS